VVQGCVWRKKVIENSISTNRLDVEVHICNPRYMGGIDRRITV
jgi:hypothetical protein